MAVAVYGRLGLVVVWHECPAAVQRLHFLDDEADLRVLLVVDGRCAPGADCSADWLAAINLRVGLSGLLRGGALRRRHYRRDLRDVDGEGSD